MSDEREAGASGGHRADKAVGNAQELRESTTRSWLSRPAGWLIIVVFLVALGLAIAGFVVSVAR